MRTRLREAWRAVAGDRRCETPFDRTVHGDGSGVVPPEAGAHRAPDAAPRREIGLASPRTTSANARLPPEVFLG